MTPRGLDRTTTVVEYESLKVDSKTMESLTTFKRDPEEEYFMLAVLGLKMLHNEKFDDAIYAYTLSPGKLFKAVRSEELPFHRWYPWLENMFMEVRSEWMKQEGEVAQQEQK